MFMCFPKTQKHKHKKVWGNDNCTKTCNKSSRESYFVLHMDFFFFWLKEIENVKFKKCISLSQH